MIEAQGLSKQYGPVSALKDVSFTVRRGEVVGFLGPNGAGKTTTMKILTCYLAPTAGTARIRGIDVFADPIEARRSVGYLPESTPLYTDMQVREYLEFMAKMRGLRGEALAQAVGRVSEQTSLGDVLWKQVGELSKGYKQRVGLAQALVHEPPILILDEPMSGLDPNQATEIRDLIAALGKERTVILSTHNLAEVQVSCQRVLIVSGGAIVADDTTDDLRGRAGRARYLVTLARTNGTTRTSTQISAALAAALPECSITLEQEGPEEWTWELRSSQGQDLRAAVFQTAVREQWTLLELRREGENLEQVFRDLTLGTANNGRGESSVPASTRKSGKQTHSEPSEAAQHSSPGGSEDSAKTEATKPSTENGEIL